MQIIHQSYRVGEIFDSGKHSELPIGTMHVETCGT